MRVVRLRDMFEDLIFVAARRASPDTRRRALDGDIAAARVRALLARATAALRSLGARPPSTRVVASRLDAAIRKGDILVVIERRHRVVDAALETADRAAARAGALLARRHPAR